MTDYVDVNGAKISRAFLEENVPGHWLSTYLAITFIALFATWQCQEERLHFEPIADGCVRIAWNDSGLTFLIK